MAAAPDRDFVSLSLLGGSDIADPLIAICPTTRVSITRFSLERCTTLPRLRCVLEGRWCCV